ncbi:MAG: CPBP family intramembrane metalloprotease [Actinomycetota bacterium]|nr:CPBP family intramembrane metalloprotease [Actinomycetota bacterium]
MSAPGLPAPSGELDPNPPSIRSPGLAGFSAVGFLAGGAVVGSLLAGTVAAFTGSTTSSGTTLAGEIGLWVGMAGAAVFVSRRFGSRSLRRDFGLAITWRDLWPAAAVALVVGLVVTNVVAAAFSGTRFAGTNTGLITGQKHNGVGFAVITIIVAVGAPFFEELYFRGVLRTALASRVGPHAAVWIQAAVFGLLHFQPSGGWGNVSVIIIVGALGVVLGYTARATRRLGPGMIAHGLFNTVQVAIVLTS